MTRVSDVDAMHHRSVLRHHAERRAHALLRHSADILPVDADAAPRRLVETQQQVDQGRLAGARAADEAHALAGADREVQVVEHARAVACAVVEAHVLEADLAARHLELARARQVAADVRYGDRLHAFLHHADALEDSRYLPAHPAGDVGDLPGEGQASRHDARAHRALRPEPDAERAGPGA